MKSWVRYLIFSLISLTPLIPSIFGLGFEQSKVIFFLFLSALIVLIWSLGLVINKQSLNLKGSAIKKWALLFVGVLTLTSLMGINPTQSIFGAQAYFQGLIVYWLLFWLFIIISQLKFPIRDFANALFISAMGVSLIAIYQWILLNIFHQNLLTYSGRVISTFGQPNLYSGFLVMIVPFLFYKTDKQKTSWWNWICLILVVFAIIISESRSAIAILFIVISMASIILLKPSWQHKKNQVLKLYLLAGGLIIGGTISIWGISSLYETEIIQPQQNVWQKYNAPEKRIFIWSESLKLIFQRPVFGYGLENIPNGFQLFFANQKKISADDKSFSGLTVNRSHNYFLDIWLFAGIVGVFSYIFLVGLLLIAAAKAKTLMMSELITLIIYFIWISFNPQSITQLLFFWFIAGLIDSRRTSY